MICKLYIKSNIQTLQEYDTWLKKKIFVRIKITFLFINIRTNSQTCCITPAKPFSLDNNLYNF